MTKKLIQSLFFTQGPSASAYVTYYKSEDALRAIQAVNNVVADGRTLKASLGTTKYCSHFMKNMPCPKHDCMYLHELGNYHYCYYPGFFLSVSVSKQENFYFAELPAKKNQNYPSSISICKRKTPSANL